MGDQFFGSDPMILCSMGEKTSNDPTINPLDCVGRCFNIALLGGGQREKNTVVLHPSKTNGLNHL